jgi:multicomponent K+:H+ antiporter subunit G
LKLREPMQRLHAPTKATTIGVGTALFASILDLWIFQATLTWQELLVIGFLFLTAPITALYLAKAHLHLTLRRADIPPTGTGRPWATYSPDKTPP